MKKLTVFAVVAAVVLAAVSAATFAVSAAEYISDPLIYTITDEKCTIVGTVEGVSGNVDVPSLIGKYEVVAVADGAFKNCADIESVSLSDSVTKLGNGVFEGCTGLVRVSLGNGVTEITDRCFKGCSSLEEVTVSKNLTVTDDDPFLNLRLPARGGVSPLAAEEQLTVTRIGSYAFSGCKSLVTVKIPDSVVTVGDYAFEGCTSLTDFDLGRLTAVPNGCFAGCTGLLSLAFDSTVTAVGDSAFKGCTGIKKVSFHADFKSIGNNAFDGCTGITSVYYAGSEEGWARVEIGSGNEPILNAFKVYGAGYALGDVSGDDAIDNADAALILRCDAGLTELTDAQLAAADVNGDEVVDNADAALILRLDAGLINKF